MLLVLGDAEWCGAGTANACCAECSVYVSFAAAAGTLWRGAMKLVVPLNRAEEAPEDTTGADGRARCMCLPAASAAC